MCLQFAKVDEISDAFRFQLPSYACYVDMKLAKMKDSS